MAMIYSTALKTFQVFARLSTDVDQVEIRIG
jgi:hypothetical protein